MKTRTSCTAVGLLASLTLAASAHGSGNLREKIAFDINAPSLVQALMQFTQQSGLQLMVPTDGTTNSPAPKVVGSYTPTDALDQLLVGSPLRYEFANSRTVAIRLADGVRRQVGRTSAEADGPPSGSWRRPAFAEPAIVPSSSPSSPTPPSTAPTAEDSGQFERTHSGIPEILINGSRTLNADIERTQDDVRPYVILDRKTIERSVATSVDELLRMQLAMNYVPLPNGTSATPGALIGNSSQIALRGLSGNETLILVDGRRTTTTMSELDEFQSSLNGIPLSAIERIEVLPASASGIYGGSATGGVVNVVLRRDYSGIETTLNYQNAFEGGGGLREIDLFGGMTSPGGDTSFQLSGSYSDRDSLTAGERSFVTDYRVRRQEDQIARIPDVYYNAANPVLGATTNISSVRLGTVAPNLVLKPEFGGIDLNSPITSVPSDYAGVRSDHGAALVERAGKYNVELAQSPQFGGGTGASLIGGPTVASLDLTVRRRIGTRIDAFVEVGVSQNRQYFNASELTAQFAMSALSPANPFEQDIVVEAPLSFVSGSGAIRTQADDLRALTGISVRFGDNWSSALEYSYSKSKADQVSASTVFQSDAGIAVENGEINLLQNPAAYIAAFQAFALPQDRIEPTRSHLGDVVLRVAGPLLALSPGSIKFSALAEARDQYYGPFISSIYQSDGSSTTTHTTGGRSKVSSLYGELTVPLASEAASFWGISSAELQIAGRYDDYEQLAAFALTAADSRTQSNQKFHSLDPSVGLRIRPVRAITLRASYSDGFRPPYLSQLQEIAPFTSNLRRLTDPKRQGERLGLVAISSPGNSHLQPESSKSASAGFILSPQFLPSLRFSLDWTRIKKDNNIVPVLPIQQTINDEALLPGVITRAEAAPGDTFGVGRIVSLDLSNRNATRGNSESYDFSVEYAWSGIGPGTWEISGSATRLAHNRLQQTAGGPLLDRAGTIVSPNWGGNMALTWQWKGFSVAATGRFLDSYWINTDRTYSIDQGAYGVPSQTYVDLAGEYKVGTFGRGGIMSYFSNTKFRFGVRNVLDKKPRYLAPSLSVGYSAVDDPLLRSYFVTLRTSLGE